MADHIQIGDISPRIQYTGDGSQTDFTYPFPIFADADIEVYEDSTLKTLTTHYTVSGAGDSSGGTASFLTAPAVGVIVTLRRNIAIQRTSDFQDAGEFRAKVINDELDKLTAMLQQVNDDENRSLRLGPTDIAGTTILPDKVARASKYLGFDAAGDPIATDAAGPQGPQGPGGDMSGSNNLSELTNTATARANLGLGSAAVEDVAAGGAGDLLRADGDGSGLTGFGGAAAEDVAAGGSGDLLRADGDGSSLTGLAVPDVQLFTSSGTWTKPSSGTFAIVEVWGGGGSGGGGNSAAGGGGGGSYVRGAFALSDLGATETVTVGAGGAGSSSHGNAGSSSTFGSLVTAYGGGGGASSSSTVAGGGGAGTGSAGSSTTGTTGGNGGTSYTGGTGGVGGASGVKGGNGTYSGAGGGGGAGDGGGCIFGGGGGGGSSSADGGPSMYGGGGGSGGGTAGPSVFGGAGGAGGAAGVQPGGGSGRNITNPSEAGGAGQCRVTVI